MSEEEFAAAIEGLIEMGLLEPIYDFSIGDYRMVLTPTGRSSAGRSMASITRTIR
jgi:hypothetical protein